ncbi:MAG TPA: hypothetical protein PKY82_22185 [Pyrinomonadaceae bacterium]|nr:hypothetical protein [Pyrinomonadaceae bacterium]
MKTFTFLITLNIFLSSILFAQNQPTPDFQTVKTEKGMMVLNNNQKQPFAFLVAGKNPEGSQRPDGSLLIQTDSAGLLIYFVKTSSFLEGNKQNTESEVLTAYRDWDISAQEKGWKTKLIVDDKGTESLKIFNHRSSIETLQNISSVYWSYLAPGSENPNRSFNQTVMIGDLVLLVGTVFESSVKTEEVRQFFKQTLESITLLPIQKPKTLPKKKITKVKKN